MDEEIKRLVDLSIHYRGVILHDCIALENKICINMAYYFVNSPALYKDIREVLIDRLTFDAKIAILKEIMQRQFPDEFGKKYDKLFSELRVIKEIRNRFAHYPVYTYFKEDAKIPKEFSLINFRDGDGKKVFSKGDFELTRKRIIKCIEILSAVKFDK
jgi:hypothetical protein